MAKYFSTDEHDIIVQEIASKLLQLKTIQDIELFIRAFLTPSEVLELCDRYLIVKALIDGNSQRDISKKLGVSISKITAGSRELKFNYGKDIFKKFINL